MRQKLKKYRFVVGVCGPTVLHTNIIKAYDPEGAARQYLDSTGKAYSEDDVKEWASKARLVEEIEREAENFVDVRGEVLHENDLVAFVQKVDQYTLKINHGTVSRFTKAKVFVKTEEGEECGYVSDSESKVTRLVKLNEIVLAEDENALVDALGQSIEIGDEAVYLGAFRVGTYGTDFTDAGAVTEIKNDFVHAENMTGRKKAKSFVVIK